MSSRLLLTAQMFATLAMFGVIWFVQVVHYPLFQQQVGAAGFRAYAAVHANRTTMVVAPLMLVELATSMALLLPSLRPAVVSQPEAWVGAALVFMIWLSTALVQVPLHDRLRTAYTVEVARQLVATNWIRTAAWTARAGLVLVWLARAVR